MPKRCLKLLHLLSIWSADVERGESFLIRVIIIHILILGDFRMGRSFALTFEVSVRGLLE